jgi:hypothetical protein
MPDAPKPAVKCQEALARAVAKTKGENSSAGKALAQFLKRREAGEDVVMFPLRGKWLVAPASEVQTESDRVGALSKGQAMSARREKEVRASRDSLATLPTPRHPPKRAR